MEEHITKGCIYEEMHIVQLVQIEKMVQYPPPRQSQPPKILTSNKANFLVILTKQSKINGPPLLESKRLSF